MEFWFAVLTIVGVFTALWAPSAVISYTIALISGMFAGTLIYERKHKIKFPYLMIIAGFLIGFIIGVYYGSRKVVVIMFILGAIISYQLYNKKVLKGFRF